MLKFWQVARNASNMGPNWNKRPGGKRGRHGNMGGSVSRQAAKGGGDEEPAEVEGDSVKTMVNTGDKWMKR